MSEKANIESYLEYVGRFCGSKYGRQFRTQFRDQRGTAELSMLKAPNKTEYDDFRRAVSVMTEEEKARADKLTDEEIQDIARRAKADPGNVSIFINGYVIEHLAFEKENNK